MVGCEGLTIVQAVQYLKKIGFESTGRQTLRQYEAAGLITTHRKNKYRVYTVENLERLELILTLRDLDFSIAEIKKSISHWDNTNKLCFDIFKTVRDTGIIDEKIKQSAAEVKESFDKQTQFIREKIIGRIREKIAVYEIRAEKQQQKIQRLENSSRMIEEIINFQST